MVKGHRSYRQAAKLGVFVMSLVLALAVPCIAFAANTASFSSATPGSGSTISVSSPSISVVFSDRYGVSGPTNSSLTLDGVKKVANLTSITGLTKRRMTWPSATNLAPGVHTVTAWVRDKARRTSTYTWRFTVAGDRTPPVTTSDAVLNYTGSATIHLSAHDNVGMGVTYYMLDSGALTAGTVVTVPGDGKLHMLEFWSVDAAGNVEAHHVVFFIVSAPVEAFVHPTWANSCTTAGSGCHSGNIAAIHAVSETVLGCEKCHASSVDLNTVSDCTGNAACHANLPIHHTAATHFAIVSSGPATQTCTQAICHGNSGLPIAYNHSGGCAECHASTRTDVKAAILAGGATCETCHSFAAIHNGAAMATGHTVSGSCFAANCHGTDVSKMHTIDFRGTGVGTIPGCFVCHAAGKTPSTDCQSCHADIVSPHDYVSAHGGMTASYTVNVTGQLTTNSSACVSCHKSDLTKVMLVNPGTSGIPTSTTGVDEHKGCSCHAYAIAGSEGMVAGQAGCQNCHAGAHAAHGFGGNVSGHNTTTYGIVGAHTLFDGTEGVVVKNSVGATITQDWPLPTADVFWSQVGTNTGSPTDTPAVAMANRGGTNMASAINTTVGWGSVITCQDCHTGLVAAGPQGANIANVGLDPNFPDDWTTAEFTTWDPTGMRSVATTAGTSNPYYTKVWDNSSVDGTITNGALSSGYSFGTTPGRFICSKCHKLTNWKQGYPSQTRAGRSQPGMGVSNSAHMEHHPDQIRGQANCVACHVAIPHGWSRPRLLVYETDTAPYLAAEPTTATPVYVNGAVAGTGNWFYGFAGSTHLDSIYGGAFTASLETSPVVPGYGRELVTGSTTGWNQSLKGVEWIAPGTETGAGEGQPNCNACSATGSTHTPASEGVPAGLPLWK